MLTGQAKKDYQREYMRRRRSNKNKVLDPVDVRPKLDPPVRPIGVEYETVIIGGSPFKKPVYRPRP